MDGIIEALKSGNIIAWVIVVLLLVLALKLIQSLGKGFLILLAVIAVIAVMGTFFPGLLSPLVDFVHGGWLGD